MRRLRPLRLAAFAPAALLLALAAPSAAQAPARDTSAARGVVEGYVRWTDSLGVARPAEGKVWLGRPSFDVFSSERPVTTAEAEIDARGSYRLVAPAGVDTLTAFSCYFNTDYTRVVIVAGDTLRLDLVARPVEARLSLPGPLTGEEVRRLLPERDAAVRAVGLAPLAEAALPPGTRELRLSAIHGFRNYGNGDVVRLVEAGGEVRVEVVAFWDVEGDSLFGHPQREVYRYDNGPLCGRFYPGLIPAAEADSSQIARAATAIEACPARLRRPPDARALLAALDALGAATLPGSDGWALGECIVTHARTLFVEVRDERGYRAYTYDEPDAQHPFSPEVRAAGAILDTLWNWTWWHLPPPGGYGAYRGHVVPGPGRDGEFHPCGGGSPWLAAALHNVGLDGRTGERFYVEAWGSLGIEGVYEWDEREPPVSGAPRTYPRRIYLQRDSDHDPGVAVVREAAPGDCEAPPVLRPAD